MQKSKEVTAKLYYVTPPQEEQLIKIKNFLIEKYSDYSLSFELIEDKSLGGGFIIRVGTDEYDWSTRGRKEQLEKKIDEAAQAIDDETDIITLLKTTVEDFSLRAEDREVGFVKSIGDGIAVIDGLSHAMYGEIVIFENGIKGMVQNIESDQIGIILFGDAGDIGQGSRVVGTGKQAGVPVGSGYLGRVVNALGEPIDGAGDIRPNGYSPIEQKAPGIIDRKSVSEPMQTGILAIDSMFPIGRGQRELIIGDRQTGKTTIATDAIINQKGQNCICVYVAIGQKASTVAALVQSLKNHDAMDYTIVVTSSASEPAPMQYIAPYAATSLAEYFMYEGKDVLIVYDDLSKHAVAYRALSLLLGRSPGREAYPGDVFYLHSRLLERSSRLAPEKGGGSITALPIIETQAGDVSAYIPTNVISITDGQIYLESDLFFEGQRPAVNVGLSVSRVGGAAQTKATKKAVGSLRVDLAQFREMEVFTQFSSDLDDATKAMLKQGQVLMELLKQPNGHPVSMHDQVITLTVALKKMLTDIPVEEVKSYQMKMLEYFAQNHPDIGETIETTRLLEDKTRDRILEIAEEFRKEYMDSKEA